MKRLFICSVIAAAALSLFPSAFASVPGDRAVEIVQMMHAGDVDSALNNVVIHSTSFPADPTADREEMLGTVRFFSEMMRKESSENGGVMSVNVVRDASQDAIGFGSAEVEIEIRYRNGSANFDRLLMVRQNGVWKLDFKR